MAEEKVSRTINDVVTNIENDDGKGVVYGEFIDNLNNLDKGIADVVVDLVLKVAPNIESVSDVIQRAYINRIFIHMLLLSPCKGNADVMLVCNLRSPRFIWASTMAYIVVKKLIEDEVIKYGL